MSLTSAQKQAVGARGNVLVVAGAGTGKTRTLVERCLSCLLDESPPASFDEILMVTFTDAAAAEMRQRIRRSLQARLEASPGNRWILEQLALFDAAHIGTLHSFCLQLIRQEFYALELDPQLAVLAEEEGPLLAQETLQKLLEACYGGKGSDVEAVQRLIEAQGRGSDTSIRRLILRLHDYTQTLPDPEGWFESQLAVFKTREPVLWDDWFLTAVKNWRERWLPILRAKSNPVAQAAAEAIQSLPSGKSRAACATALNAATRAKSLCVYGQKKEWIDPIADFFEETTFLASLAGGSGDPDPLQEDWNWAREHMATLVRLAREFTKAFTEAKREMGVVDFHDLEQYALKLLWDPKEGKPTRIAEHWRHKLRFVFVDEYQDINAAQDKILECLSRAGEAANRFLVGDVKQSIYRFRLANPHIFQGYVETWGAGAGSVIPLADNFRSREEILGFVNSLFPTVMRPELGGVAYDDRAHLNFVQPEARPALALESGGGPSVELCLRARTPPGNRDPDEGNESPSADNELEEADKEARFVAARLRRILEDRLPIWDEAARAYRPVKWSDMAILLRSPSGKSQRYAREFARLGVPLAVARGEFYGSLEISDLVSLLQLLDNPIQDLPLLAVLHSPLVGLSLEDLAFIRLAGKGRFWTTLSHWHSSQSSQTQKHAAFETVDTFLRRYGHWRRLAREASLSHCLEAVLGDTEYAAWILAGARGEQRHANLRRFLDLAQKFDRFQRQSLFRFLRFIESQQDTGKEPEAASAPTRDAVRLLSIHQSKGLEFPVVVLADLAKPFNTTDLSAEIILDEVYGLCPMVKPPHTGKRYPSLPYWLARQRQMRELLGEELRLLYVALTRARDHLILVGTLSGKKLSALWTPVRPSEEPVSARAYSDWISRWFSINFGAGDSSSREGANSFMRWEIHEGDASLSAEAETAEVEPQLLEQDVATLKSLRADLEWRYPFAEATQVTAKSSVTMLRRRATASLDPEPLPLAAVRGSRTANLPRRRKGAPGSIQPDESSSADIGNAHHTFLELVSLDQVGSVAELRKEAERLSRAGALSAGEIGVLKLDALAAFWRSEMGKQVLARKDCVRRELPFTARFSPAELATLTREPAAPALETEFVVVQGVADLVVLLPKEIWICDFKTDSVHADTLAERARAYEPQVRIYAEALRKVYRRPITQCWLYFIRPGLTVHIEPMSQAQDGGAAPG